MRHSALATLVLAFGCGRSGLGTSTDAGTAGAPQSQHTDVADGPAPAVEAQAGQGDAVEAASACAYEVGVRVVLSCGGGYAFSTEMVDGWGRCPTYFVYGGTQQAYDSLSVLLSENGCDSSCRWESDRWEVVDCSGRMDRITDTFVTGYSDPFRRCPIHTVWFSNVTGRFYENEDEAWDTLPVCADAGT